MRNCSGSRELMKEVPNSPMCVPFGFSDKAERSSFIKSEIISELIAKDTAADGPKFW